MLLRLDLHLEAADSALEPLPTDKATCHGADFIVPLLASKSQALSQSCGAFFASHLELMSGKLGQLDLLRVASAHGRSYHSKQAHRS